MLQEFIFCHLNSQCERSISITKLDGKTVLRLVAVTPHVTLQSLRKTIAAIKSTSRKFVEDN